jgi:hypothetical protein
VGGPVVDANQVPNNSTNIEKTGLFEQFRGYFDLEEIDLAVFCSLRCHL